MKLGEQEWLTLSRLLDEALALPAERRRIWLDGLPDATERLKATLRDLLECGGAETSEFLKIVPQVDREAIRSSARLGQDGIVGPYRLLRQLGRGGMGSVWLAERTDRIVKRPVALKLPHEATPGVRLEERSTRERDILAALSHPHIARLYDAGVTEDGQPYLALEYVDGQPIGAYCDAHRLDVAQRLALFLQVLDAVQYAHARLVVHRDLKPSNILVDAEGQVHLLDFGIAKLLDEGRSVESELTQAAGCLLTPHYASPEQISGAPLTTATDAYSLGVILYELITGQRPYRLKRESRGALEEAILEVEILRPSAACEDPAQAMLRRSSPHKLQNVVRGDLDTIVLKALKKIPAERYPSVSAFTDDIRRFLAHEPVSARPDSLSYRTAKFVRRNRLAVGLIGLAVVALVGGLAGMVLQAKHATRAAAIAEEQRNRADLEARSANEQRDFALRELSRAEAVRDLNQFLLSEAAPSGKPFTAGELLSRAEAIIDHQYGEYQHAKSDVNRAEMLVAIGSQHLFMERDAEARRLLTRAYELSRGLHDGATHARAACALASAIAFGGDAKRAEGLFQEGIADLSEGTQFASDRVACLLRGSEVAREADDPAQAVARARAAQGLLPQVRYPSKFLELRIAMNLAKSYRFTGDYLAAIVAFEDAGSRLVELGREDTRNAIAIYANWGNTLNSIGQFLQAESLFRRAVRLSTDAGNDANVSPMLLADLAYVLIDLERIPEAARVADRAYDRARAVGDETAVSELLVLRARAHRKLGDRALAEALLGDAEVRTRSRRPPECVCFAEFAFERAALAQARGDDRAAIILADRGMAIVESSTRHRDRVPFFLRRRAELNLAQHRFNAARADAARALELDLEMLGPGIKSGRLGLSYLALGRALVGLKETEAARRALASAVDQMRPTMGSDHRQTKLAARLLADIGSDITPRGNRGAVMPQGRAM
jgi:serine/threonine-protein kinase